MRTDSISLVLIEFYRQKVDEHFLEVAGFEWRLWEETVPGQIQAVPFVVVPMGLFDSVADLHQITQLFFVYRKKSAAIQINRVSFHLKSESTKSHQPVQMVEDIVGYFVHGRTRLTADHVWSNAAGHNVTNVLLFDILAALESNESAHRQMGAVWSNHFGGQIWTQMQLTRHWDQLKLDSQVIDPGQLNPDGMSWAVSWTNSFRHFIFCENDLAII